MAKLAIDVVLNKAAAMTGLRGLEKDFVSFGKSVLGAVGIGGGLAGLVAGIDGILAKAGQLQDVSDAFNVSAESIQRLAAVGVTANLSIEEIGSKLGKIGKAAQDAASGNTKLTEAFVKIKVTGQELVSLNPEQLFNKLREAISTGALAGEDLNIVNDLLARDYQRFLPLLRMTTEEFTKLGGASIVMSDAMVSNLDAANVVVRQFQNQVSQATALAAGSFLDLVAVFKENPLMLFSEDMDKDLEKSLKRREEQIKQSIENERKIRAGQQKTVQDEQKMEADKKAFEKSEAAAADHEDRITKGVIAAKNKAEEMKADIEEKYRQRSLDREIEMEKKKNDQKLRLQDLLAKEGGQPAEVALLESRAQDAAKAFRDMPSTDTATALAEARGALKDALVQQISDQSPNAAEGFASVEAQGMIASKGLGTDLSGFAQPTEAPKTSDPSASQDFFDSLKTSVESQLKQDGGLAEVQQSSKDFFDSLKTSVESQLKQDGGLAEVQQSSQDFFDSLKTSVESQLKQDGGLAEVQQSSQDFFDSLKTSVESQQEGMQSNLPDLGQKLDQFRVLERVPDIASELIVATKTLNQILEEIRKGDGSVFR